MTIQERKIQKIRKEIMKGLKKSSAKEIGNRKKRLFMQ